MGCLQLLDIARDVDGLHMRELRHLSFLKPVEKIARRPEVRAAGVQVSDVRGEEIEEAARSPLPGGSNDRGQGGGRKLAGSIRLWDKIPGHLEYDNVLYHTLQAHRFPTRYPGSS